MDRVYDPNQAILYHPNCHKNSPGSSLSHDILVSSLISSPPVQFSLNGGSAIIRNTEQLSLYIHSLETNFFCAESLTPFPSHSDGFPETENGPRPDMRGMLPASRGDPRYFAEWREGLLSSARFLMDSIEVCGLIGSENSRRRDAKLSNQERFDKKNQNY